MDKSCGQNVERKILLVVSLGKRSIYIPDDRCQDKVKVSFKKVGLNDSVLVAFFLEKRDLPVMLL